MTSDTARSARVQASGRLTYPRSPPSSGISAAKCAAGTIQSAVPQKIQAMLLAGARIIQEAPDASSTYGAARQKLGRVAVRHFRDWLCVATRTSLKVRGISVSEGFWHEDQGWCGGEADRERSELAQLVS